MWAPLLSDLVPVGDARLAAELRALAARAGVSVDTVLVMDASRRTMRTRAYVTGLGSSRRIVLYDTLLRRFTRREVMTAVAHELGHVRNADVPRGLVLASAACFVGLFLAATLLRRAARDTWFEFYEPDDPAGMPFLLLVLLAFVIAAQPVVNALSRQVEREADRFALALTRDPEAFIEVERKYACTNLSEVDPPHWAAVLLDTYPTVLERIAMALEVRDDGARPAHRAATTEGSGAGLVARQPEP